MTKSQTTQSELSTCGNLIRKRRTQEGFSVDELAEAVTRSAREINEIEERGIFSEPIFVIRSFADALGLGLYDLTIHELYLDKVSD